MMLPHPGVRLSLDGWAAAPGDGAGHTRTVFQTFIGGVDDRISRFSGDIALYQLEAWTGGKGGLEQQGIHKNILPPLNKPGAHPRVPLQESMF
jgi:hypothetical protein